MCDVAPLLVFHKKNHKNVIIVSIDLTDVTTLVILCIKIVKFKLFVCTNAAFLQALMPFPCYISLQLVTASTNIPLKKKKNPTPGNHHLSFPLWDVWRRWQWFVSSSRCDMGAVQVPPHRWMDGFAELWMGSVKWPVLANNRCCGSRQEGEWV